MHQLLPRALGRRGSNNGTGEMRVTLPMLPGLEASSGFAKFSFGNLMIPLRTHARPHPRLPGRAMGCKLEAPPWEFGDVRVSRASHGRVFIPILYHCPSSILSFCLDSSQAC